MFSCRYVSPFFLLRVSCSKYYVATMHTYHMSPAGNIRLSVVYIYLCYVLYWSHEGPYKGEVQKKFLFVVVFEYYLLSFSPFHSNHGAL